MSDARLDALRDELLDGLEGPERDRLSEVHARLVDAGPIPELPPGLTAAPEPPAPAPVVRLLHRYRFTAVAAAAAVALVVFAAGWLLGGGSAPEQPVQSIAMTGVGDLAAATGDLALFEKDAAGNWPMELTVSGLEPLPDGATYELWLTRDGELAEACGTFAVQQGETVVRLNAPYRLKEFDGWVVTAPDDRVVLQTTSA